MDGPGWGKKVASKPKNENCVCYTGAIHSVATEDIPKGTSVMAIQEGIGKERRWVTVAAPFQIHRDEKKKVTVKVPESKRA